MDPVWRERNLQIVFQPIREETQNMNVERVLFHADWSGRVQHVNNTRDVTETREYLIMGINTP